MCSQSYATKRHVRQKSVHRQPAHRQPAHHQPVHRQPEHHEPIYHKPIYQQPVYHQPVYQQPFYHQQVYQTPTYYQPAYQQSPYYQPNYNHSVHQPPILNQAVPSETFIIKKTYPNIYTSKTSQFSDLLAKSSKSPLESDKRTTTNIETTIDQQPKHSTPSSRGLHHEVVQPITDTLKEQVSGKTDHQRSSSPSPLPSPEVEWICVEEERDEKSRRNKSRKSTYQHDLHHKRAEEKKNPKTTQSKIEPRYYTYRYVKGKSTRNPPQEILPEKQRRSVSYRN